MVSQSAGNAGGLQGSEHTNIYFERVHDAVMLMWRDAHCTLHLHVMQSLPAEAKSCPANLCLTLMERYGRRSTPAHMQHISTHAARQHVDCAAMLGRQADGTCQER